MNKASFLTLVRQASRISDQDVEELEKLVVNFPYCQSAHLLIAKAAYDQGSMLSNQKLKKAAIYAANRQLLKKLIFTSDASVSLQPLETETVAEMPPKPEPAEISTTEIRETETPETTAAENHDIPAVATSETTSENLTAKQENSESENENSEGEKLLAQTNAILAEHSRNKPELTVAEAFYEDAAIAEEILEEGRLPENEIDFVPELNEPETFSFTPTPYLAEPETSENETVGSKAEKLPARAANSETVWKTEEKPKVPVEDLLSASAIVTAPETGEQEPEKTVAETPEKVEEPESAEKTAATENPESEVAAISEPETTGSEASETVGETPEKVGELVAEAAHTLEDVPGVHELFLENAPENVAAEPDNSSTEIPEEPERTSSLHDDLLHETLASFDQYLFRPEKELLPEAEERPETDDELKIVYPDDEIQAIYEHDKLGYWMSSSRMGESLQIKDELTSTQPYDFHPELIWEYSKTHELRKEIKPAPSKLSKQLEIIDEFLKMTPRLKVSQTKVKTEAQEDLSSKSSKINKNLASENFANILVQQGKIKKAIKIYEHLILKIPEKKAYFVAQIEKLQNQN